MTATLGDILLVLLDDQPGTALDLQRRHTQALGPQRAVDITRVVSTLSRQERLGYVRADPAPSFRRHWSPTEAGRRRQRAWLLTPQAGVDGEEVLVRVLVAVVATDRATFDTILGTSLALLEVRGLRAQPRTARATFTAEDARLELEAATVAAQLDWLRGLRARRRFRDQ